MHVSSALRVFRIKKGNTRRHMIRLTPMAERPFLELRAERKLGPVRGIEAGFVWSDKKIVV